MVSPLDSTLSLIFAGKRLHKNLHIAAQTQDQVERRLRLGCYSLPGFAHPQSCKHSTQLAKQSLCTIRALLRAG